MVDSLLSVLVRTNRGVPGIGRDLKTFDENMESSIKYDFSL